MQYTIVKAESLNELVIKVNEFIGQGWEPIGGVSAAREKGTYLEGKRSVEYEYNKFLQAIVKRNLSESATQI